MHAWYPQIPEDSIGSPGARITDMSCYVGAGNWTQSSGRVASAHNCWAILLVPVPVLSNYCQGTVTTTLVWQLSDSELGLFKEQNSKSNWNSSLITVTYSVIC